MDPLGKQGEGRTYASTELQFKETICSALASHKTGGILQEQTRGFPLATTGSTRPLFEVAVSSPGWIAHLLRAHARAASALPGQVQVPVVATER